MDNVGDGVGLLHNLINSDLKEEQVTELWVQMVNILENQVKLSEENTIVVGYTFC